MAPGKARMMRISHDYHRGGALAYLAAYDVHRAKIYGRCEATTGIEPFTALVAQVMTQEPYASADRVFWVVDNGSSHRGQKAIDRLAEQFPNAVLVHTPVHASWLNQVEVYFSIIQRKALSPNDFTDLDVIEQRLTRFEVRYNTAAKPPGRPGALLRPAPLRTGLARFPRIRLKQAPKARWQGRSARPVPRRTDCRGIGRVRDGGCWSRPTRRASGRPGSACAAPFR